VRIFGTVVVSAFALGFGLLLAIVTYRVLYGSLPECPGFAGLVGSQSCGGGNPSFQPYGLGSIALAALIGLRGWVRFVRSLDAESTIIRY
jgi:hypothetical protein